MKRSDLGRVRFEAVLRSVHRFVRLVQAGVVNNEMILSKCMVMCNFTANTGTAPFVTYGPLQARGCVLGRHFPLPLPLHLNR